MWPVYAHYVLAGICRSLTRPTILVIEDEPEIRRFLCSALEAKAYGVAESATARRGAVDAGTHEPDVVIVDLGLPDFDSVEVVRQIRQWSHVPILVLSARAQERAKIEAFEAGADDYVTKPFGVGELLARIKVALRHTVRAPAGGVSLRFDRVVVDLQRRAATRDGVQPVHLTPIEFRLLAALARHLGMVVTHRKLPVDVWGPTHAGDTHYLRVYMTLLRDKLEADPVRPSHLLTEIGVG